MSLPAASNHRAESSRLRPPARALTITVLHQKFLDHYVHAANYAAGVYMAGAGYSLAATLALAKLYAIRHSSNYNAQDQLGWIQRGVD